MFETVSTKFFPVAVIGSRTVITFAGFGSPCHRLVTVHAMHEPLKLNKRAYQRPINHFVFTIIHYEVRSIFSMSMEHAWKHCPCMEVEGHDIFPDAGKGISRFVIIRHT